MHMNSPTPFALAAGTISGRDHVQTGRNNQDALHIGARDGISALVVCDGCGSGEHSEVGAWLGARWTVELLLQKSLNDVTVSATPEALLESVRLGLLRRIRGLARSVCGARPAITTDALFTIVGALITPSLTLLFSLGDGLLVLNGETLRIGPFPGNEPPYVAYGLTHGADRAPKFVLHHCVESSRVNSLLIGTDGVGDWCDIEATPLPGRTELAGPLSQFWEDERYFANADAIRRKLALVNRPATLPDWNSRTVRRVPALLRDDTTLIVARRTPQGTERGSEVRP